MLIIFELGTNTHFRGEIGQENDFVNYFRLFVQNERICVSNYLFEIFLFYMK